METYYTIPQVAAMLHLSKTKVYDLAARNEIEHIRLGYNVRITQSALDAWLKANTKLAAAS